jgi:adenine phosphoribosyltransferase
VSYHLEYGEERLELHDDAVSATDRVLIVDDVLATGGTARAACDVVRELGAEVAGVAVIIELGFLGGRSQLTDVEVFSIVTYD